MALTNKSAPLLRHQLHNQKETARQRELESEEERHRLWKAAIKVPMYTVAVIPIFVGSTASYSTTGVFHLPTFLLLLLTYIFLTAWVNTTNDAFDYDTGIDTKKRESIVNLLGGNSYARNITHLIGFSFLIPPIIFIYIVSTHPKQYPNDLFVCYIIVLVTVLGYMYQGPPFRLGYYGLGEPIVFVVWFLGTVAAFYSQYRLFNPLAINSIHNLLTQVLMNPSCPLLPCAVLVALATTIILFCSHFHQENDDRAAGKLSPIVRLGGYRASLVLRSAVVGLYVVKVLAWLSGWLKTIPVFLTLFTIPLAEELVSFVAMNYTMPNKVRPAKYYAVKLHFCHGMCLTAGLFASRYFGARI